MDSPVTLFSIEDNFISAMEDSIDGGSPEDAVRESLSPFRHIQIGCNDCAFAVKAFGYLIVEIFILNALEWFEPEIIDNQQIDFSKFGQLLFITVGCPGRVQLGQHPVGR